MTVPFCSTLVFTGQILRREKKVIIIRAVIIYFWRRITLSAEILRNAIMKI